MHVEADKYNTGALVQKYETGIKGFFKDEDLVSWQPGLDYFRYHLFPGKRVQKP